MAAKKREISPMHGPVTASFLEQASQYNLRFQCDDCVFFDDTSQTCVHNYPNEPHLSTYFEGDPIGKVLIFCRDFELGE